jgi:hypothetical protein
MATEKTASRRDFARAVTLRQIVRLCNAGHASILNEAVPIDRDELDVAGVAIRPVSDFACGRSCYGSD